MKSTRQNLMLKNILVGAVLGVTASVASAAIVVPPSLSPGDKYHLVFVTSTTRNATSTNIADYNSFVQAAADAAGIGSGDGVDWFAIGSTQTVAAKVNALIGATNLVFLLNGTTKVADGFTDMWNGSIDARINLTETLATYNGAVRTGSSDSGAIPDWNDQWLGDPAGEGPVVGSAGSTNTTWLDNGAGDGLPSTALPFYALSEELTVPTVPEPGTMGLLGLASGALLLRRRRKN